MKTVKWNLKNNLFLKAKYCTQTKLWHFHLKCNVILWILCWPGTLRGSRIIWLTSSLQLLQNLHLIIFFVRCNCWGQMCIAFKLTQLLDTKLFFTSVVRMLLKKIRNFRLVSVQRREKELKKLSFFHANMNCNHNSNWLGQGFSTF